MCVEVLEDMFENVFTLSLRQLLYFWAIPASLFSLFQWTTISSYSSLCLSPLVFIFGMSCSETMAGADAKPGKAIHTKQKSISFLYCLQSRVMQYIHGVNIVPTSVVILALFLVLIILLEVLHRNQPGITFWILITVPLFTFGIFLSLSGAWVFRS